MNELIKIIEHNGSNAVSARELHRFLEVKDKFTDWIKRMFEYGFTENIDYQSLSDFSEKPKGGRSLKEYALSMDCAKEISMIQRSEKGKQARQYFIECEKKLKSALQPAQISRKDLAVMVIQQEEEIERLQIANSKLNARSEFVDVVFSSDGLLTLSQAAKSLNLPYGRNTLCKKLREIGIFFKNSNEPKQDLIKRGYFRVKEFMIMEKDPPIAKPQTYVTQKGLAFIAAKLNVIVPRLNVYKTSAT